MLRRLADLEVLLDELIEDAQDTRAVDVLEEYITAAKLHYSTGHDLDHAISAPDLYI